MKFVVRKGSTEIKIPKLFLPFVPDNSAEISRLMFLQNGLISMNISINFVLSCGVLLFSISLYQIL